MILAGNWAELKVEFEKYNDSGKNHNDHQQQFDIYACS